jgi:hypothetical protein
MKNCVVQFYMDTVGFANPNFVNIGINKELLEYSKNSARLYAERCQADYILVDQPKIKHVHPTFERFDLFFNDEWWTKYDHILYLDTDVICWPSSPDIFKMYNNKKTFKVCEDKKALQRSKEWHKELDKDTILNQFDPEILRTKRFNAGVFMLNQNSAKIMRSFLKYKEYTDDDNKLLVYAMLSSGVPTEHMDSRFNKKNGVTSWFGHGYGQKKYFSDNKLIVEARKFFKIKN